MSSDCGRPRPISNRPVLRLQWRDLLFLHWSLDPAQLRPLLPPGIQLDTFLDRAYLGLIALTMRDLRPSFALGLPWFGAFSQVNLRTYVVDETGDSGVLFLRLEADQPVAAWLARRWFGLPYFRAGARAARASAPGEFSPADSEVTRLGEFIWRASGPGFAAAAGSLEHFLTERYRLVVYRRGWRRAVIEHSPFVLRRAELLGWDSGPIVRGGLAVPNEPPESVLTAAPTHVAIHGLEG